ncbi:MAG: hypothetical protein P4L91_16705, partial [Burkholderiaceae bacterium]|nr:hypothetical protein [Burkholderiaceae bacterium]
PQASLFHFPIYWHLKREPEGQPPSGRLSLLPFFGEAKKGSGCRATPGKSPRSDYQKRTRQPKTKS